MLFLDHMKTKHSENSCPVCKQDFESTEELIQHVEK